MIQREESARMQRSEPQAGPVRTCIGCRKRELAVDLLRVVAVDSGGDPGNGQVVVTVDTAKALPGRGAWLHPRPECLHAALRRRAFGRALRITGSPDITAVIERVDSSERPDTAAPREQVAKNMSTP